MSEQRPVENTPDGAQTPSVPPMPWVTPMIKDLPRLEDITLQTGGSIPGGFSLM